LRNSLAEHPEAAGWYGWYAVLRERGGQKRTLIGAGGFIGPPGMDGVVEIGYSVHPRFEGRGLATEIVCALVAHAFKAGGVTRMIAHTTEGNIGSMKVLERAGFRRSGGGGEGGSVEFVLERPPAGQVP
jgi:ribosomal-protein-alanine N-acetyltransferase